MIGKTKKKILTTLAVFFLYSFGNLMPLPFFDTEAFTKKFGPTILGEANFFQNLSLLGNGTFIPTYLSLGIFPYINASAFIDLLIPLIPYLERLRSEEGSSGQKELKFYKKMLGGILALFQAWSLVFYFKEYFFNSSSSIIGFNALLLTAGSFCAIWLTEIIDEKGIGKGTSFLILLNTFRNFTTLNFPLEFRSFFECFLLYFVFVIYVAMSTLQINIPISSAGQTLFLGKKSSNELSLYKDPSLSRASILPLSLLPKGTYPIIIASSVINFFVFCLQKIGIQTPNFLTFFFYYPLIIFSNCFYQSVIFDTKKISKELQKSSVSIYKYLPGLETEKYLTKKSLKVSIQGGLLLAFIVFILETIKLIPENTIFQQINSLYFLLSAGILLEYSRSLKNYIQIRGLKKNLHNFKPNNIF